MSVLVSFAGFFTVIDTLFWDLPGEILAAPASALWPWKGVLTLHTLSVQLFGAHISMLQLLWQHDMLQLVRLVIECLDSFAAAQ